MFIYIYIYIYQVFDVSFLRGSADVFGTVGADGSLRVFDLR
jgi:hypothetical protein